MTEMTNKQLYICNCPLECQEFCYIARTKREAQRPTNTQTPLENNTSTPKVTPLPIHPLHVIWAFIILLILVFSDRVGEMMRMIIK